MCLCLLSLAFSVLLKQVVQNEPVKYPEDVAISGNLRDLIDKMLTKVGVQAARAACELKCTQA